MTKPDQHRVRARYRLAAALAGAVLVAVFFLGFFIEPRSSERSGLEPAWLVLIALWTGPFILHAALARTLTGTAVGASALLVATGGFLYSIFNSESSTAGIGLLAVPLGGTLPLAFAALGLDIVIDARTQDDWPRLRSHLAAAATLAGFVAALFAVMAVAKLVNTTEGDHPLPLAGAALGTAVAASSLAVRARLGHRGLTTVK